MSFLDYLKDNRGLFIDHRVTTPASPGVAMEIDTATTEDPSTVGGASARATHKRRTRGVPRTIRFRHVRPAFAPSPYSDPLPYEEPWERAFR